MPRITGHVTDIDHGTSPYTDRSTGEVTSRPTITLHVFEGREVTRVRLGDDFPLSDRPEVGDAVDLRVEFRAWSGRSGAGLACTALKPWAATPALAAAS